MMKQYLNEALATCETLLRPQQSEQPQQPEQPWTEACHTVGNILTSMGFIEEAYPWRSMAFDLVPNSAKFYAESGRVCSQCEDWDRAIYFCQRTLEYEPDSAAAHRRLAKVYARLGDRTAESQTLYSLLSRCPDKADAAGHHQLGQVLRALNQSQAAIDCYQRAIAQDASYAAAYYALGDVWSQQGQQAQTVELFERLVAQLPEEAIAQYRLGRAYRQTQQTDRALAAFRRALDLDNRLHWAYMGLLNTLMQQRQWDQVIAACQQMVETVEEFPFAYCFMGNALAKKGALKQAARSHQRSFALRGWPQPTERDDRFGYTWFSENIPVWEQQLAALNQSPGGRSPIHALAVGTQDGSGLLWLMDTVLNQPEDRLTCIGEGMSEPLQRSLAQRPYGNRLMLKTEAIAPQLAALPQNAFDLAYIQSDCKQADYLQSVSAQIWTALKMSGLMFFKDYHWRHLDPSQSAQVGIDAFIASVSDCAQVLCRSHQVILKKGR
ncbi:MAG: tetratricopeptide repeat protein [Phormidesmis sp.]